MSLENIFLNVLLFMLFKIDNLSNFLSFILFLYLKINSLLILLKIVFKNLILTLRLFYLAKVNELDYLNI